MKKILILFIIIILIISAIIGIYINKGYKMYKEALIEDGKIEDILKKTKEKENYTKLSELPDIYIKAVLAVEDNRFYKHKGINIRAIGRAIINDIKNMKFVEGGSTITQQLAKNIYFTQAKKMERKVAEIFMTYEIEKELTKDEILELYLNTSYFGDGYYTVKEASRGYFNKEPMEMTAYEAILLAGIPNAPSVYAPTKNPELAIQRQKQVIEKMITYKYITREQANEILKNK